MPLRSIPLLLLLAVATALAGQQPAAVNLDFEEGADERGRPASWMGGGKDHELAADTAVVHGGVASGRISARDAALTDEQAAPLVQILPADAWRGKRVRLSGWLRTKDVASGWAGLWMRVDSETKPNLAFDNMPSRGPRGTTEWKRYEVVLDVAPEASNLFFGVILAGNGTVWADDLALEEVPQSVPVTALPK